MDDVYRETLGSALDLGTGALVALGITPRRAERAAKILREHDEISVREMAKLEADRGDEVYASIARKHIENLEKALASDREIEDVPIQGATTPEAAV